MNRIRFLLIALFAVGLVACGDDAEPAGPRELPTGLPDAGVLMRLPSDGGQARLYRIDSLTAVDWDGPSSLPEISRALGFDLNDQMVYAVTTDTVVIGIDLLARRSRAYLAKANHLSGTADGVVLGLDSARRPLRFSNRDLTTFRATVGGGADVRLVRAQGTRLSAYAPGSRSLQLIGEDGELHRYDVPAGHLASSWFGDILAITTDSGLSLVQPSREMNDFVELGGTPISSAFSPSAHRIYVARARGDVVVLDRFSRDELATIDLPGAPRELRPDRSGRWLLARAEVGDSVWVVDLVRGGLVATLPLPWADDLPLVSGGRYLLGRQGADIVSWNLISATPTRGPSLEDAAEDVFLALDWRPRGMEPTRPTVEVATTTETPEPEPDTEVEADPAVEAPAEAVDGEFYIQVTSSQNEGYAKALARQLSEIGFRTRVRDPESEGSGYRVLVGPYQSRDEAEADGRRLGRPYFITTPANPAP